MPVTPPPRRSVRTHLTAGVDKIPTKWIGLAVVALFLAVSAAFGGLADAPVQALPQLAAGESVTGAQLRVAVNRVVLVDSLPEQYIVPEDGGRLLIVVATVENVFTQPVATSSSGAGSNLRPMGVAGVDADTEPVAVIIVSDGTRGAQLQPGIPERLAYVWEVPRDAVADGDDVRVDIFDKVMSPGFITYGSRFDNPFVSAFTTVPVDDLGSGAGI